MQDSDTAGRDTAPARRADHWSPEADAPEADVTEQRTPVLPDAEGADAHVPALSRPTLADVNEADQLDQEREEPWDDEDRA
jgi:hypothetical protein